MFAAAPAQYLCWPTQRFIPDIVWRCPEHIGTCPKSLPSPSLMFFASTALLQAQSLSKLKPSPAQELCKLRTIASTPHTQTCKGRHEGTACCRLFDMGVTMQQGNSSTQTLVFHPWQGSTPDVNISNVNATAVISTGGIIDNVAAANSKYRLFMNSTSARGKHASHKRHYAVSCEYDCQSHQYLQQLNTISNVKHACAHQLWTLTADST